MARIQVTLRQDNTRLFQLFLLLLPTPLSRNQKQILIRRVAIRRNPQAPAQSHLCFTTTDSIADSVIEWKIQHNKKIAVLLSDNTGESAVPPRHRSIGQIASSTLRRGPAARPRAPTREMRHTAACTPHLEALGIFLGLRVGRLVP